RRSRQSHDTKHTRAHALGDRFDGSPLAGAIAPFKHNHDPPAFCFDPFLEMTKFRLQPAQLLHVLLVLEFWFLVAVLFVRHRTSRLIFFLHRVALSNTREVGFPIMTITLHQPGNRYHTALSLVEVARYFATATSRLKCIRSRPSTLPSDDR